MRLALALGGAVSAIALAASAQPAPPAPPHVMVMHHGPDLNIDANNDGWISRAEASAAADRMFDHMDANHDGRLTPDDRPTWHDDDDHVMAMREGGNCQTTNEDESQGQRRVTVVCHGDGEGAGHAAMAIPDDPNCQTTTEDMGQGQRRVTVNCHGDQSGSQVERHVVITRNGDEDAPTPPPTPSAGHQERHSETEVIVRTDGEDAEAPEAPGTPVAPMPPHPPHPPMMMMLFANSEEMDTNHDGAISREEFRTQQLRFFDASDANHDGKIRFEPPPEPPMPPMPPMPPSPVAPVTPPAPPAPPAPHH